MERSRRQVLGSLVGTATVLEVVGCSGLPFLGSGGANWTDFLHAPDVERYLSEVGDAPVRFDFEYSEPSTILDRRSALADDVGGKQALRRYEKTHAAVEIDASAIDRWTETGSVVHGANSLQGIRLRLIEGHFEREAVGTAFQGRDVSGYRGWERYANAEGTRAIGIGDETVVLAGLMLGDPGPLKRPIPDAVERAIDVVEGRHPPSIEDDPHGGAVAAPLDDPLHARGSTTLPENRYIEGLQATGGGSVDPDERRYRWVGVFEDPETVPTDDLQELLNAGFETWGSVERSGRVLTVTGRVPPKRWLG